MTNPRLEFTRAQILARRRNVGALDERLPPGEESLLRAAWAGLQDSMPRAALLSIHARMAGASPSTLEDPSLVQLWGPRFSAYVVSERDLAVFSLGRLPDAVDAWRLAEDLATGLDDFLGGGRLPYSEAGRGPEPGASGLQLPVDYATSKCQRVAPPGFTVSTAVAARGTNR